MSIRQDQAQLIITIDAKESVEYQKAVQRSNELVRNIKKMEVGTDEYIAALREQAEISKRLGDVDYTKLSRKDLADRKKSLEDQIRILPQATAAELGLERELQRVNTQLAENARRTRAVGQVLQQANSDIRNFIGAYVGIGAAINLGQQLFDQIKQIDSLNKAYQLLIPVTNERARADAFLTELAKDYGLEIQSLRDEYIKYNASASASTLTLKDQELVFASVAKASSALGLSTETQSRAFAALQQIMSKGKVSAEELKGQLGDALPGAVTIMAKALGVGVGELQKMLEAGEVMADEALPKFAIELQKAYGVANIERIDSVTSAQNRFKNIVTELITVIGDGFNKVLIGFFNVLTAGLTVVIAFAKGLAEIPKFIKENEVALKAIVLGLVIFNSQMILASANSLRLAAVERGRAIITGAVTVAQNLLNAAMTANPIGLVIRAVGLLVVGFGILYAQSETVRAGISGLGNVAKEIFSIIKEAVSAFIDGFNELKEGNFKEAFKSFSEGIVKTNPIGVALTQGKRLKDAFNKGFNDKIEAEKAKREAEKQAQDLVNSLDKVNAAKNKLDDTNSDLNKTSPGAKPTVDDDDKKEKKSKKEDQFSDIPKAFTLSTTSQLLIDERMKALEDAEKRAQLFLEESYRKGEVSLEEYELERLRITQSNLATRIELLDAFGQQESDKRRELNTELLKIESDIIKERAAQIGDLENAALADVEQKFLDRLIGEEEYNLSRLAVQKNFLDEQLRLLEENGLTETEVYKKIQEEKKKVQADYNAQKLDNEKRTQELMYQAQEQNFGSLADLFALGADLLAADEKARRKHASAIKAFAAAEIAVNLALELQSIWRTVAKLNAALPGSGFFYGIAQSALSVVRAGLQIAKVNAQKFEYGGQLKDGAVFDGPSHQFGGIKFRVGGEINEAEGGEIIINKKSSKVFAKELDFINSYKGYGRKLFNRRGIVPSLPSTTPTNLNARILSNNPVQQPIIQTDPWIEMLANAIEKFAKVMPDALSNINANVSYFDFKSKENTLNEIKDLSSY